MGLQVIQTLEKWSEVIERCNINDTYYTYEYCNSNAQLENGRAILLYYEDHIGIVIYPIIIRKIDFSYHTEIYDTITPYGYGGPLVLGNESVLKEFRKNFLSYCKDNHIISETITFHPLLKNAEIMGSYCELQYVRKTTAIDLVNNLQSIRFQYSGMNKRNIIKAHKSGLICKEVNKTKENIMIFLELYNKTMDRQNANSFYYFSFEFIERQLIDTPISKTHLLFVYHEDKVISAVILFTTAKFSHYYLGASNIDYLNLRPNNLIFDYMVELSKDKGCTYLHLGGGYEDGDGLFNFKCSFSNNNVYDYYMGKNIIDKEIYNLVVNMKKQVCELNENYFPLYRGVI